MRHAFVPRAACCRIAAALSVATLFVASCGGSATATRTSTPASSGPGSGAPTATIGATTTTTATGKLPASSAASSAAGSGPIVELNPTPAASESSEPVSGSRTAAGDVPDNAVFLTYRDTRDGYSIQYVEGWQVTRGGSGVTIADKDSSEKVEILPAASRASYLASDLAVLQGQPGFKLLTENRVRVNGHVYDHRQYQGRADPDPVTGKQVPSTIDRYYVPGPGGVAVVTLSTPDGVDNVDAFRQMIESFAWK